ncbi:uncharacterized protein Gasu_31980 [Galdieria sulphuraria]|uniref:Protein S-acyltransferase n=1 Tax=Galdieria sulphuraria TaxID=130081 RepID=M2Y0N6_GALSU|nr:uncharacterized protein Gasu_31980 [Galdieria sulphuraria]EME29369.1 hypothetical protein Gasu_31980 [Galdieria sulphuraria]|eukprot:XP_005705889.1 hypothetical protein Gasu_31980 [Galdieria sulphuraria]
MTWLTCIYLFYCIILLLSIYVLFIRGNRHRKKGSNSVSSFADYNRQVVSKKNSVKWWFLYPCCLSSVVCVFWKEISPGMEAIDSWWSRPFFVWFHYLTSLLCWLSCVLSSPGVVMKETDVSQYDIAIVQHTSKEYCFICQVPKAPGSKHCYFCNVCVPR